MTAAGPLAGQVAVVTGGSRGVGRAIAERLAVDGTAVAVLARTMRALEATAAAVAAAGGRCVALRVDVTDREAVGSAVDEITRAYGPVTLLVNNAGSFHGLGPVAEVHGSAWWRDLEVHVHGALHCTQAVLHGMREAGAGRIVNIVGELGLDGSPYVSSYAAAKAALWRLTEAVAAENEDAGIRVFAVSPGLVRTAMTERLVEDRRARRWLPAFQGLPEDAWRPASEAAALVARIARGDADALTGRYLHVRHDLDALVADAARILAQDSLALRLRRDHEAEG